MASDGTQGEDCHPSPPENQQPNQEPEPPSVILYRSSSIKFLKELLSRHYRVIDPVDSPEPIQSFLFRHGTSVRVLVVVGLPPLTSETLSLLPSLELVVTTSVGVDHVDLAECRRRGIAVTNAARAFTEDTADYAVALLIDVLRRLSASDRYVRSGLLPSKGEFPVGFKLTGKRIGIVGLGNIGSAVANRLAAFSCAISYHSRTQKPDVPYQYYPKVIDLAAENDVLILCCTLTDQTRHIINRRVMLALGKDGVLINVGRGGLVDEKELVRCLAEGEVGGAGLDVFEEEPKVPEELFGMDNVVLSPHMAVLTPDSFASVEELALENLKAFFSGQPLASSVRLE